VTTSNSGVASVTVIAGPLAGSYKVTAVVCNRIELVHVRNSRVWRPAWLQRAAGGLARRGQSGSRRSNTGGWEIESIMGRKV